MRTLFLLLCFLGGAISLPACRAPGARLTVDSIEHPVTLAPEIQTAIYRAVDLNTADIYLSDIPIATLLDEASNMPSVVGNVIHIHLFIYPSAGRVPVGRNACNVTVRHVVLARGRAGMYGGGGFLLPDAPPGQDTFGATVRELTLQLLRYDSGFIDRLGAARMTGDFKARRDDAAAAAIGARLDAIVSALPSVAEPDAP